MIGNTSLWIVVGTDTFCTVTCTNLQFSFGSNLFLLLSLHLFIDTGAQNLHCFILILVLASFILTLNNSTGRNMGNSDCRLGLVYMLTACTARTVGIDLKIFWIDFNLNVIHFRQNSNGNGGCVDTALCFGFRYTLYTVNTRFKFEFGVSSFTVDGEAYFLVTAKFGWVCVEDLDLPALAFCIHRVHSEQAVCKQSCLVTACTAADLNDNVLVIVRIFWNQQNFKLFRDSFDIFFAGFILLFDQFAEILVQTALFQHHFCLVHIVFCLGIFAVFFNDWSQVLILLHQLRILFWVADNIWVHQLVVDCLIAFFRYA